MSRPTGEYCDFRRFADLDDLGYFGAWCCCSAFLERLQKIFYLYRLKCLPTSRISVNASMSSYNRLKSDRSWYNNSLSTLMIGFISMKLSAVSRNNFTEGQRGSTTVISGRARTWWGLTEMHDVLTSAKLLQCVRKAPCQYARHWTLGFGYKFRQTMFAEPLVRWGSALSRQSHTKLLIYCPKPRFLLLCAHN